MGTSYYYSFRVVLSVKQGTPPMASPPQVTENIIPFGIVLTPGEFSIWSEKERSILVIT
jgi:hypothetical protein